MLFKKLISLFAGIFTLSLVACSTINNRVTVIDNGQRAVGGSRLTNTLWRLVSFGELGYETEITNSSWVTLQFQESSQASGSGGCNTFGARYDVADGNQITITEVSFINSALVACSETGLTVQETQYIEALRAADSFELYEDTLTIYYGGGHGVLNFLKVSFRAPHSVNL